MCVCVCVCVCKYVPVPERERERERGNGARPGRHFPPLFSAPSQTCMVYDEVSADVELRLGSCESSLIRFTETRTDSAV